MSLELSVLRSSTTYYGCTRASGTADPLLRVRIRPDLEHAGILADELSLSGSRCVQVGRERERGRCVFLP